MSRWTPEGRADAQSDQRLAELARAGDQAAFAAIVARYHGQMLGMAHRLCSDGRAEDVVQQTFLNALVAFRSGAEVRHLRGWLHQILRHAAARVPAQTDVSLEPDFATGGVMVSDEVERRLAVREVLSAMAALPDRQRQAMVATTFEGRSRSSIAEAMGLSEGAVRQLTHRARQTLRAAAYALTPWPLQRWLSRTGSGPGGNQSADVAAALSSSPLPAAAAKLAAVVASGALAVGYISPAGPHGTGPHPFPRGGHAVDASSNPRTVPVGGERARLAVAIAAPTRSQTTIQGGPGHTAAASSGSERNRVRGTRSSESGGNGSGPVSGQPGSGSGPDSSSGASNGSGGRSSSGGGPGPSPSTGSSSTTDSSTSGGSGPSGSSDGGPGPSSTSGSSSISGSSDGGSGPSATSGSPTTTSSSGGGSGPSVTSGSPTTTSGSDGGPGPTAAAASSDGSAGPGPATPLVDGGSGSGRGRDLSGS